MFYFSSLKTKDEIRDFLDSIGIATRILTEEQAPKAEWGLIADRYSGTKMNIPIVKGKGKNMVELIMNITIDEITKQLFTEPEFVREFNLSIIQLNKVKIIYPSPQNARIQIIRNLYNGFSEQELVDSLDQIVKTVQFIFAFIEKHAKGKANLKTSQNVTQGIG